MEPFKTSKHSVVCSQHFKEDDFERPKLVLEGFHGHMKAVLKSDEIGVSVVPSIHTVTPRQGEGHSESDTHTTTREHRMVSLC